MNLEMIQDQTGGRGQHGLKPVVEMNQTQIGDRCSDRSIWLVTKAWINVSIDSWWAIDALLATDVSGSNKLSIFRSAIHAIHDELQVQVNSKVVHDVTPLQDGADGLHVTLSMEVAERVKRIYTCIYVYILGLTILTKL